MASGAFKRKCGMLGLTSIKSERRVEQRVSKMEADEGVWKPLWLVIQVRVDGGGKPKEVAPAFESGG